MNIFKSFNKTVIVRVYYYSYATGRASFWSQYMESKRDWVLYYLHIMLYYL